MEKYYSVVQVERLPRGVVEKVAPSLMHHGKVYAYEVAIKLASGLTLQADVRQFPLDILTLVDCYGELVLYVTEFADLDVEPFGSAHTFGRYLGPQLSVVFFPELLTRYRLHSLDLGDDDIDIFQDDYTQISDAYHPLGFPIEPNEEVWLLHTDFGVLALGVKAVEQIEAVVQAGEQVFFSVKGFSLISFKTLPFKPG